MRRIKNWTDKEVLYLEKNYRELGSHKCAKLLDRTVHSVENKASRLFFTQKSIGNFEEIRTFVWITLNRNAKNREIIVNISMLDIWNKYIYQNKKCALSDLPIVFGKDWISNTASIDRIDSKKGYEIDNIQIVHKDVNKMKMNLSEERFLLLCSLIYHKSSFLQR